MMNSNIKESASRKTFQVFNYILLIGITLLCIYPFWYVVIYTLSDPMQVSSNPPVQ